MVSLKALVVLTAMVAAASTSYLPKQPSTSSLDVASLTKFLNLLLNKATVSGFDEEKGRGLVQYTISALNNIDIENAGAITDFFRQLFHTVSKLLDAIIGEESATQYFKAFRSIECSLVDVNVFDLLKISIRDGFCKRFKHVTNDNLVDIELLGINVGLLQGGSKKNGNTDYITDLIEDTVDTVNILLAGNINIDLILSLYQNEIDVYLHLLSGVDGELGDCFKKSSTSILSLLSDATKALGLTGILSGNDSGSDQKDCSNTDSDGNSSDKSILNPGILSGNDSGSDQKDCSNTDGEGNSSGSDNDSGSDQKDCSKPDGDGNSSGIVDIGAVLG